MQRGIIISSLLLGVLIGVGSTKFVYDNGLFSSIDIEEFINGFFGGTSKRVYDFKRRANLANKKEWTSIVNTREFQILSQDEKDIVRVQYYKEVIAPTLPKIGVNDAEDKFQIYASLVEETAGKYGFFEEPLDLPATNDQTRYASVDYLAPLEIKTQHNGYHYYVKISDWNTNIPILSIFIRSGDSVNVDVPIGTFLLKYATGKTWYGAEHLFGPETSISQAEKSFNFSSTSDSVSGYTVELYRQVDGNLPTKTISRSEW